MRRLFAILVVASLGLGLPGCSLFKKNTAGGGGDSSPSSVPPPKFPTADSKADPLNGHSRAGSGNGLLAGRVLDENEVRPPGGTSILVVSADSKDDSGGQELSVSPEGYFTIENLKSGGQYKLIARGKQGDRAVAGVHYATAPNIHVMIRVKNELVTSTTPNVQGPFGSLKDANRFEPISPQQTKGTPIPKDGWQPTGATEPAGGEISLPPVQVAVRPDGFKQSGGVWIPPTLEMPNKANVPETAKIAPIDLPQRPLDPPASLGAARVPSCVKVGNQLVNFALNDVNGEPWELKANRKGKLVLLDFWATDCVPCLKTMPTLRGLQSRFGGQGLEVIGIANEKGGTPGEQAYQVNEVCKKLVINYRQLLGSGRACIVSSTLEVQAYPTLILLDEQGNIIWRHVGTLGDNERPALERLIQSRLGRPAAY